MSNSEALDALRAFVRERDSEQFHTPENLAKSVCIEAVSSGSISVRISPIRQYKCRV
jgi:hypothetical protein